MSAALSFYCCVQLFLLHRRLFISQSAAAIRQRAYDALLASGVANRWLNHLARRLCAPNKATNRR